MTLKSALQDVKETTLSAISGLLARLAYLGSLRRTHGHYDHWGMEVVHGREASERALKAAHSEVIGRVLRAPLASLEEDLQESSESSGMRPRQFADEMQGRLEELVPDGRENTPSSTHLNSVLRALSSLERNRGRATRSTS
jgi:hypothetical protein